MDQALDELDGKAIGLAAVQVAYPKKIFLLRNGKTSEGVAFNSVFINPKIISVSKETKRDGEACLSLPGLNANLKRPKKVKLEYQDLDGKSRQEEFSGIWAKCVIHEMNHLRGRLISHEMQKELDRQPKRTKFGMVLNPQRLKAIAARRVKKKYAKK